MDDARNIKWHPTSHFWDNRISHLRKTANADKSLVNGLLEPPIFRVWWAALEPGGFVVPHIDAGPPFYERWHFPIEPAGFFWEDGVYYEPTEPFMVRHWLPHAVWNPTDRLRLHLMAERQVTPTEAPKSSAMIRTELIPEIKEMIPDA